MRHIRLTLTPFESGALNRSTCEKLRLFDELTGVVQQDFRRSFDMGLECFGCSICVSGQGSLSNNLVFCGDVPLVVFDEFS